MKAAAELERFTTRMALGCAALVEGWFCLGWLESSSVSAPAEIVPLVKTRTKPKLVRRASRFVITFSVGRTIVRLHKVANGCRWAKLGMRDAKLVDDPLPEMYDRRCEV